MAAGIEARRATLAAKPHATAATLSPSAIANPRPYRFFQRAVIDDLRRKTFRAAEQLGAASLLVSGGVAANRELRVRFTAEAG